MKLKDLMYVYGSSCVYEIWIKFYKCPAFKVGLYTVDVLNTLHPDFLAKDVVARMKQPNNGKLIIVV